jgi:hypothetical protein
MNVKSENYSCRFVSAGGRLHPNTKHLAGFTMDLPNAICATAKSFQFLYKLMREFGYK